MSIAASDQGVRKRPALFRALGRREPPLEIRVQGQRYRRVDILKHDSWAATAIYEGDPGRIVCKFNRVEPIFGLPMTWLGCWLAERERRALTRLAGLAGIPPVCGDIHDGERLLFNAVAHAYIEGHPLGRHEAVSPDFFPTLSQTLAEMHRRGIAYVDLHKRENIIVGEDGRPYLVDFQIHFQSDNPLGRLLLGLLCRSDDYHFQKHVLHHGGESTKRLASGRPWWIRVHRRLARPFREMRRRLLAWFRIRKQDGRAESEHFAEDAVRREKAAA